MLSQETKQALAKHRIERSVVRKAQSLTEELIGATNAYGVEEAIREGMLTAILSEHPTLAQSFMRTLHGVMEDLAKNERFGSDLRGQAAKQFAKHCASFEQGFPHV